MRRSTPGVRPSCTATSTTTTSCGTAGRYVAIDAKAMLGEPEFDVPSFLWNPLESAMTAERTERRIAAFAAAGLDEARIRAWTVVRGAYLGFGDEPEEADVIRGLVP